MRRRETLDAVEERPFGVVEVTLLEVVANDARVRRRGAGRIHCKHLRLAREREPAAGDSVVERLDSEPVARREQTLRTTVPDRKRPHADETLDRRLSPHFVCAE